MNLTDYLVGDVDGYAEAIKNSFHIETEQMSPENLAKGKEAVSNYNPDYTLHPGEYLDEVLESRNIKKSDLAKRCGLSVKQISQIIGKHAAISSHTALAFEKALGISSILWNNLNASYQLFLAREEEKAEIEKKKERTFDLHN